MAQDYTPAMVPTPGQVVSVVLQMSTFGVLCICFTRRTSWLKNWRSIPLAIWLILLIYIDSTLFVLATSIIVHGLGINSSRGVCEGGILLCLVCYMTTKILIYYFLVERAYIVRGSRKPRLKTKLWLFNCVFMMLPYTIFVIMNFVWRITYINEKGVCIIGMQKIAMLPLITFEVIVNIYLTLLFILPLRKLYSYRHSTNPKLNRMAFRSLIGSLATLTTSVANLTVLMILRGEPGWICLMCCNADILFCVLVLHWVTSKDKPSSYMSTHASRNNTLDEAKRVKTPMRQSVVVAPEKVGSRNDKDEIVECILERQQTDLPIWPYEQSNSPTSPVAAKLPGSVTTEIRSSVPHSTTRSKSRNGRVLHKSRDDGSECGDEVELHKIHVQRVVCVDTESSEGSESGYGRGLRSSSVEDAWGMKRSVSAEKMV
ncbi:hypothetical protein BU25DRAFT_262511 [Macroventuria anomochaeta]|uniref:Uncharacterized protein n=1 Tax=Macroventuria anomochaeta TaxID=301207 RepID=A0ACB6S7F1_9PLEO|nr:uncharacterized protein BU25DRAFT_262511 [Macroventuria anomochaeta]KAF2629989.1 hypothetical protein BU25DRAFT_262511 [Macroventuria anomochaeta]